MSNNPEGKTAGIVAYLTLFGVIIAYFINFDDKKEYAFFHIRQSLGLWLLFFLISTFIGYFDSIMISGAFYVSFIILWFYGFLGALSGKKTLVPLVGDKIQEIFKKLIGNQN